MDSIVNFGMTPESFDSDCELLNKLIDTERYEIAFNYIRDMLYHCDYTEQQTMKLYALQSRCEAIDDGHYTEYDKSKVEEISVAIKNNQNSPDANLTVTVTTCKRLDLFGPTVNSFIACCTDLKKYIKRWVVVDDNSSDEDRVEMSALYPFIEFIHKTPEQTGHSKSMNIIREVVDTPFIFHMEDDWRFFTPWNFITRCLRVLNMNEKYGQCLLNKVYGEDIKTFSRIAGGYKRYTKEGDKYFIHEYVAEPDTGSLAGKLGGMQYSSCSYWPHYSLRVGVTRMSALRHIGKFDNDGCFEMIYGVKYVINGYITTYLNNVYCTHTGRRTYERDGDKLNAYDLNKQSQFGSAPKTQKAEPPPPVETPKPKRVVRSGVMKIKTHVINLKRREDRLKSFREDNDNQLISYNIFDAIDGKKLTPCHNIQKLFEHNDYKYRRGIVGCALSHIVLWQEIITTDTSGIIIEDDAKLTPHFTNKAVKLIADTPNADIIFFGHHAYKPKPEDAVLDKDPVAEQWTREKCQRESAGGTTAYFITPKGARNMMEFIREHSVINGIDWVMFKTANINNIYYSTPHIAFAPFAQMQGASADTDIQNCYDTVGYSDISEWIFRELDFWGETGVKNKFPDFPDEYAKKHGKTLDDEKSKISCYNDMCTGKQLLSYVSIFPNNNSVKESLHLQPVKYYTIGKYIFSVPEHMIDERVEQNVMFADSWNSYNFVAPSVSQCR